MSANKRLKQQTIPYWPPAMCIHQGEQTSPTGNNWCGVHSYGLSSDTWMIALRTIGVANEKTGYYFVRNNRFLPTYVLINIEIYAFHSRGYKLQLNILMECFFWRIGGNLLLWVELCSPKFIFRNLKPQYLRMRPYLEIASFQV